MLHVLYQIAFAVAVLSFIVGFVGLLTYTFLTWGILFRVARFSDAFSFDPVRKRAVWGSIPPKIRRLGMLSGLVAAGGLLLACLVDLLR
ncbi:MAG: hypothetical protein QM813_11800 [Verrucomicrobiota bacterium]